MPFDAVVEADFLTVDNEFEFFIASSNVVRLQLTPRETGKLQFHIDMAGTPTDDLILELLQGHRISTGNTLDGKTSDTNIQIDTVAEAFSTDDDLNGMFIIMTSGTAQGEGRLIENSVASDDSVIYTTAMTDPDAADSYELYSLNSHKVRIVLGAISADIPHNHGMRIDARNGEWVLVRARANGSTDAHRVRMSYQLDAVDA